jgi:kynurenine 3-monooxygenase
MSCFALNCQYSRNQQQSFPHFSAAGVTSGIAEKPPPLDVAIVGAGPSGLLMAHFEGRSDPRAKEAEQRAYALGIGIRGRTAIRQVDEELWQAVKERGYESERFQLHVGGFVITLRSEMDSKTGDGGDYIEPSVLTYQTDLCGVLLDELERRHKNSGRLLVEFDTPIDSCILESMTLSFNASVSDDHERRKLPHNSYDLIVGSDGVNSIVRSAIQKKHRGFQCTVQQLPGEFKVVRLDKVPPKVDPTSVSLILPKTRTTTAFVEPTGENGSCCILFAGKGDSLILSGTGNRTAVVKELKTAFPQWEAISEGIATQLMEQQKPGTSSSVICNTYHFDGKAVLIGDAAHATGGVSGQGVNSALQDCATLADCLKNNRNDVANALLSYSIKQVPEGKALFDLSFGPKPKGAKALAWVFLSARNTLFRGRFGIGKPPLQTRLTTSLTPFSDIRRENDKFYSEPFPSEKEMHEKLVELHKTSVCSNY